MKRIIFILILFLLGFNAVQLVIQGEEHFNFQGLVPFLESLSSLDLDFSHIIELANDFNNRLSGLNFNVSNVGDFFNWIGNVFRLLFSPIELIVALASDVLDFITSLLEVLSRLLAFSV